MRWSTMPSVTGPGEGPETCSPTASQLCAAALFSSAEVSAELRENTAGWMVQLKCWEPNEHLS